ncbi:metal tolerance protein B-like [Rutidosis leptorrhynchoides]|uniref:metal tolerance protein B-like n=1 Tax=Rutidosis leptorrhynchoides TaxID=125765 RepID=UPI003A99DC63
MEQEDVPILRLEHKQDVEMDVLSSTGNDIHSKPRKSSRKSVCGLFNENKTLESEERSKSVTKLSGLIFFYIMVIAIEIVGGFKANSLAVITDAAHLVTDVAGFSIALFTVWASGWEATAKYSFGFGRLEILGALFSVLLIWQMSVMLIKEAVERIFLANSDVNGRLMFAIALFGFIVNFVMVTWLGHDHAHAHGHGHTHHHSSGHDHDHDHHHHHEKDEICVEMDEEPTKKNKFFNINIQGAYLHVMADLIQSVGVMIAGAVLWLKPEWLVVDLVCTIVFATFALITTIPMLRNLFGILMETTPKEINISRLENDLKCIKGVQEILDLHVWTITLGQVLLTCHIQAEAGVSSTEILTKVREYCKKKHGIYHATVQIE